ncbi:MAG: hypothetical protein JXR34_12175 [Bacteroidales bacterium]|nr:hypothetical protein [Bacteroidales bacterium]
MSFDPVEIEIRMRQNVDEESAKASRGMSDVGKAAQTAKEEVAESIAIQKQVIQQLKAELEPLAAAFKKANVGTQDPAVYAERKRLLGIVREMKSELKGEEDALISLENQTTKFTAKTANLETELRNTRNEMAALKMAGQQESAQYKELEQRLGVLGTAYKELTAKQKALSTGGTQMAGFISGINALSGALTAGAGAMGLFNNDSEKMQEIQTRVQSLMAITIGLQQIGNTLHSTSAFRITTLVKVKELWALANMKVATTLGISNLAAKALMATLTLGLSVAITAAIFLIDRYVTSSRKAAEESKKFNDSVADSMTDTLVSFERLKKEFQSLNKNIDDQEKFVSKNKKAFDKLGVSVNDVNDAEQLFSTSGTTAFVDGTKQRAIAIANMQLAAEKYKEYIKSAMEADDREKNPTIYDKATSASSWYDRDGKRVLRNNSAVDAADKIREDEKKILAEFNLFVDGSVKATQNSLDILKKGGLSSADIIVDFTKEYWEKQKKDAQAALDSMKDTDAGSQDWNAELAKFNEADARLKNWDFSKKEEKKIESEKAKAAEKLRKMAIETEEQIAAATIAAMQDGAEKKLAEVKADYEKRMNIIREKRLELTELEKATGTPATVQRKQLDTLENSETAKYTAANKAINDAAAYEIAKVWDEVDTRFRTALDNQLADVDRYYAEQLKKLKESIISKAQLEKASALLEKKHQKERIILYAEAQLETLAFEEEIDLRKQEISNRGLKWETDKRAAILKLQVTAIQKQLEKEHEIQLAGGDNAQQIELLIQKLKELGVEIENLPTDKFNEIANSLRSAISSIGSAIGGDFGDIIASQTKNLETLQKSFSGEEMSTGDKIEAGAAAIMSIYTMISGQIEENKRKQEEWNAAIAAAAHQARLAAIELNAYQESNLFGIENPYARAIAGAKQYGEAMTQLQASAAALENGQVQTGTKKKTSGKNVVTGAVAGAALGTIIPGVGNVIGAVVGGLVGGLVGLFTKKTVPVFASLKKQYGEIYDKDTFDLNPAILADYAKLDAATKAMVDNWQEIKDKAKEAEDQMLQTFKDLAGDIGTNLSNALVNAFRNGDVYAAMDDFHGSMTKIIEDIVSQIIFAAAFEELFKELQERMKASMKEGGDGDIVDDIKWFNDVYAKKLPEYIAAMEAARDGLRAEGYDAYQPNSEETRSGTSKALAQASQDSIDELSGRILAISRNVADMRNGGIEAMFYHREASSYRKLISSQLDSLVENTSYNIHLVDVKNALEDMNTRGIKLKT